MRRLFTILSLTSLFLCGFSQNDRIEYNGQQLFLSGSNLAWIDFARDIGAGTTDFTRFGQLFKEHHDYGANTMRLWLHTNGTVTPAFSGDTVSGPGEGAIDDLKQILDSAYKYDVGLILCLWSFDMLRLEIGEPYLTQNRAILENEDALQSYIQNALIPLVDSTKDHPAIIAWEVFNEPEGMIPGVPDGGWTGIGYVTRAQVQNVVNKIAGAIHRVNPNLKVTNGTHTLSSLSDRGVHNFYSDSALFNVGGDVDGYLDFYQVHHYDFNLNPFEHNYSYWNLDKPLIIGEFHPQCETCGEFSNYEALIDSGYAGALGWMWLDAYGESIKQESQYLFFTHNVDVDIDNFLGDAPYLTLEGPEFGEVFESGSDIQFFTEAFDTDGTIESVDYFLMREDLEDSLLTSITASPYNYTWENPDDGMFRVYVRAIDNDGFTKQTLPLYFIVGDPPRYRYEAEDAKLTGAGAYTGTDALASNGEYVEFRENSSILWTVYDCPATDTYNMVIGYSLPYGGKNNYIIVNGDVAGQIDFPFAGAATGWLKDTVPVPLVEGDNTIAIGYSWGWMRFDYIEFPFPRPPMVDTIIINSLTGLNYIDMPGGTLQMLATVLPDNAAILDVEWSVDRRLWANIDSTGLLTALDDGSLNVIARALDGSGAEGRMSITITNQHVAVPEFNLTNRLVYPNPANNILYFINNDDVAQVYISNIQGQFIHYQTVNRGENSINIANLDKGFYYLVIQRKTGEKLNHIFMKN
jgi:hypothetical protein